MKEKILAIVEASFLKAEKFYGKTFERPKTFIFKRNGTCGGYANWGTKEMMFQLDLAETNEQDYLLHTVPHEVAHYVQFQQYGYCKAHGREWKFIMRNVMRIPADRCHSYDTSVTKTKKQTKHIYGCGCGKEFKLSTTLHNKILRGSNRICGTCRGRLHLIKRGNPLEDEMTRLLKQLAS
jgi:SprT protein